MDRVTTALAAQGMRWVPELARLTRPYVALYPSLRSAIVDSAFEALAVALVGHRPGGGRTFHEDLAAELRRRLLDLIGAAVVNDADRLPVAPDRAPRAR